MDLESNFEDLKTTFNSLYTQLSTYNQELQSNKEIFERQKSSFDITQTRIQTTCCKPKIILDVGGSKFATTTETLLRVPGTFFYSMFSGKFSTKPGDDGCYFIDRNPLCFSYILDYLRGEDLDLNSLTQREKKTIRT